MPLSTLGNRFNWRLSNNNAPQSGTAVGVLYGTTVTAGGVAHTLGSYAQCFSGAVVTEDVYGILIRADGIGIGSASNQALINIGVDAAGGTSYTVRIPNLVFGDATSTYATLDTRGFRAYYFPLFIKAGSSIAANMQCSTASRTAGVWMTLFGRPSRIDAVNVGTYIDAIGANTATSAGAIFTCGGSSVDGAWGSIGTTSRPAWWWQQGLAIDDATKTVAIYFIDVGLGDATNKDMLFEAEVYFSTIQETFTNYGPIGINCYRPTPSGVGVYGRGATNQTTPDSNTSLVIYALGG